MSIVERLRAIANKLGIKTTGTTVQAVLSEIEDGLKDKKPAVSAKPSSKVADKAEKKADKKKTQTPFFTADKAETENAE